MRQDCVNIMSNHVSIMVNHLGGSAVSIDRKLAQSLLEVVSLDKLVPNDPVLSGLGNVVVQLHLHMYRSCEQHVVSTRIVKPLVEGQRRFGWP